MTIILLIALAFNGWMAFTLYQSINDEKPSGWRDYAGAVWLACGSGSGIIAAAYALLAVFS